MMKSQKQKSQAKPDFNKCLIILIAFAKLAYKSINDIYDLGQRHHQLSDNNQCAE